MQRLAIIGSGDLGQQIAYHAATDGHYHVAGFFDDYRQPGEHVGAGTILGGSAEVEVAYRRGEFDALMIGIGYKHIAVRQGLFERYVTLVPMGRIVHSSCSVDPSARIRPGAFLFPGCVLDQNVVLHENVLLNVACTIAHDSQVGPHTFLSPRVAVAGFTHIGECCNIGINTTIIDNLTIGSHIQTGGGTVVIRSLDQRGLYVGNPARFVR